MMLLISISKCCEHFFRVPFTYPSIVFPRCSLTRVRTKIFFNVHLFISIHTYMWHKVGRYGVTLKPKQEQSKPKLENVRYLLNARVGLTPINVRFRIIECVPMRLCCLECICYGREAIPCNNLNLSVFPSGSLSFSSYLSLTFFLSLFLLSLSLPSSCSINSVTNYICLRRIKSFFFICS